METKDSAAEAFAELTRQQAQRIIRLAIAGKTDQIQEEAFSLMRTAIARKRELRGLSYEDEPDGDGETVRDFNLRDFNAAYGQDEDAPGE